MYTTAKLQALKKSASKGDKKKKKEVTEEITRLEAETAARQENEILEFKSKVISMNSLQNSGILAYFLIPPMSF